MPRRYFIKTFGCQMNEYDSARMADVLRAGAERPVRPLQELHAALRRAASPGDVIAYCPDQLGPSVSRLLPPSSVVQLTFPTGGAPQFVDWVDYATRNHAARSAAFARTLVDRAGPHTLWLVWSIDYRTFGKKCSALVDRLQALRPDMKRVVKLSVKYEERLGLIRYRTP